MSELIPANPRLKRKALNFRKGHPVQLTPEMVGKLEMAIAATSKDILLDFSDRIRDLRDLLSVTLREQQSMGAAMDVARDQILEIKGLGQMIGYPLLTDYAVSLDNFMRNLGTPDPVQLKFVSLGVDAIQYVLKNKVSGPGSGIELEVSKALREGVPALKNRRAKAGTSSQLWQRIARNTSRLEKAMNVLDPTLGNQEVASAETAKPKLVPAWEKAARDGATAKSGKEAKPQEKAAIPKTAAVWSEDATPAKRGASQEANEKKPVPGKVVPRYELPVSPKKTEHNWLK